MQVFSTIFWFFVAYCWHFFGYAVAFYILMPEGGAFSNLGDSSIKVGRRCNATDANFLVQ